MNSWTELFEAWLVGGNRGLTANGTHELSVVTKPEFACIKLLSNNLANSTGAHI